MLRTESGSTAPCTGEPRIHPRPRRSVARLAVLPSTLLTLVAGTAADASAQWSNRYPRVSGYGHHVYLEGYELPTLAAGPTDPAASPDGTRLAVSARGWIWTVDLGTGAATRLTTGPDMDFRPSWSPDGRMIAFVRDNDHETAIVVVDVESGRELHTVDSPAIELDPVFTHDGSGLVYSSASAGTLDLWHVELATGTRAPLTNRRGLELRPQTGALGGRLVYLAKGGGVDRIMVRHLPGDMDAPQAAGSDPVELVGTAIASMTRPALAPDGRSIAYNWPTQQGWELRLMDLESPGGSVLLVDDRFPLTPSWSADGEWIFFGEADGGEGMGLHRVSRNGGPVEEVAIRSWDWGTPTATVRVRTTLASSSMGASIGPPPAPARLNVVDGAGHPVVPDDAEPHFDGQSGRVFFYSPGTIDLVVPAGPVTVSAVQGLATPEVTETVEARPGTVTELTLELAPVWNARAAGWSSADHHFHLNYGGPYHLDPEDLYRMMRGEALDVGTPLVANLHDRFDSQELWGWQSTGDAPLVRFGQEIRSHFLGHMGLIETQDLYWPWVWGPGYQVYGSDDRTNGEVLDYAHAKGGLGYYVHPVGHPEPFSEAGRSSVPVELVVDAVLGDVDALEIVCLWSNPVGTAAVWHRFLNLGLPIAPSAGTDVMTNFYRTMGVGTTRVYVRTGETLNWPRYLEAFRASRSFVTNGPMLDFEVGGAGPGDVVADAGGSVDWSLDLRSAVPVERVDVLVNGRVVWTDEGLEDSGVRSYSGRLELPAGGWVAARAHGGDITWPLMDMVSYAHTGPAWIGSVGSTDADVLRTAASELLAVLDVSERRLLAGYDGVEIPRLRARFAEGRARLEALRDGR